jgi:hypothetical protein
MPARPVRVSAVVVVLTHASAALAAADALTLPARFRDWKHVRSIAVTDPDHAMYGFHDGYANDAAVRGLRAKPAAFADGATFVVSIYDVAEEKGITTAGAKRRTVMQVKDHRATATGGWRFAAFDPAGKPLPIDESSCFGCHATAKQSDFVFTSLRE